MPQDSETTVLESVLEAVVNWKNSCLMIGICIGAVACLFTGICWYNIGFSQGWIEGNNYATEIRREIKARWIEFKD